MKQIIAYTDGSAVVVGKRKGNGGFGTFFPDFFGSQRAFAAGFETTKTGRMEIIALIFAIKAIPVNKRVLLTVYSDSEYVVKTFTEGRLKRWIANDWRGSSGIIKNQDLWLVILDELKKRSKMKLEMIHIKGHQYDKEKDPVKKAKLLEDPHIFGNTMADHLADYKRHKILLKSDSQ